MDKLLNSFLLTAALVESCCTFKAVVNLSRQPNAARSRQTKQPAQSNSTLVLALALPHERRHVAPLYCCPWVAILPPV